MAGPAQGRNRTEVVEGRPLKYGLVGLVLVACLRRDTSRSEASVGLAIALSTAAAIGLAYLLYLCGEKAVIRLSRRVQV